MSDESSDLFSFLNDLWSLLPEQDQFRFGETWKAYEQTYGALWMTLLERKFAVNIDTVPLYNNQRWLKHYFDTTTAVARAAHYRSNQDVSKGLNLSIRYLIQFSVDGGAPVEIDLRGANPTATTSAEIVTAINTAAGFSFVKLVVLNALLDFTSSTVGPDSLITFYPASNPSADASALILGLDPADLPLTFPEFPYEYLLGDPYIVSIPSLQNKIHKDLATVTLQEGTDYRVEFGSGIISFPLPPDSFTAPATLSLGSDLVTVSDTSELYKTRALSGPGIPVGTTILLVVSSTQFKMSNSATAGGTPTIRILGSGLWAPDTLVNQETPYNNFGYLMDIYDTNTAAYLKSVKGLWFAFWTGPRPENIRRSLYLLFGLPAASKAGIVSLFSLTSLTLTYDDQTTETFAVPVGLLPVVGLGDRVTTFQPLVSGIEVLDKVNSPGFLEREVGRAGVMPFLTEKASLGTGPDTDETKALKTIEQNAYLPQIDVDAFVSPDIKLSNVKSFLRNIQPKSRTFLFQILVGTFNDEIVMLEHLGQDIAFDATPNMDFNPSLEAQQSDLDDAETNPDTGEILDSEGFTLSDLVDLDVYHGVTLVDTFTVMG